MDVVDAPEAVVELEPAAPDAAIELDVETVDASPELPVDAVDAPEAAVELAAGSPAAPLDGGEVTDVEVAAVVEDSLDEAEDADSGAGPLVVELAEDAFEEADVTDLGAAVEAWVVESPTLPADEVAAIDAGERELTLPAVPAAADTADGVEGADGDETEPAPSPVPPDLPAPAETDGHGTGAPTPSAVAAAEGQGEDVAVVVVASSPGGGDSVASPLAGGWAEGTEFAAIISEDEPEATDMVVDLADAEIEVLVAGAETAGNLPPVDGEPLPWAEPGPDGPAASDEPFAAPEVSDDHISPAEEGLVLAGDRLVRPDAQRARPGRRSRARRGRTVTQELVGLTDEKLAAAKAEVSARLHAEQESLLKYRAAQAEIDASERAVANAAAVSAPPAVPSGGRPAVAPAAEERAEVPASSTVSISKVRREPQKSGGVPRWLLAVAAVLILGGLVVLAVKLGKPPSEPDSADVNSGPAPAGDTSQVSDGSGGVGALTAGTGATGGPVVALVADVHTPAPDAGAASDAVSPAPPDAGPTAAVTDLGVSASGGDVEPASDSAAEAEAFDVAQSDEVDAGDAGDAGDAAVVLADTDASDSVDAGPESEADTQSPEDSTDGAAPEPDAGGATVVDADSEVEAVEVGDVGASAGVDGGAVAGVLPTAADTATEPDDVVSPDDTAPEPDVSAGIVIATDASLAGVDAAAPDVAEVVDVPDAAPEDVATEDAAAEDAVAEDVGVAAPTPDGALVAAADVSGTSTAAAAEAAGSADTTGPDGSEPTAEARAAEALARISPKKWKCPRGMARISRGKKRKGLDGKKIKTYRVWCIDRYEYPGGGRPRTGVTFGGAKQACQKKGKRLCTGGEWRGACGGAYPYGRQFDPVLCNTMSMTGEPRAIVRSGYFRRCRSPWGVYDMSGNVAEWTADGRVRGGNSFRTAESARCDSAKRLGGAARYVGFRCCADPALKEEPTK